MQAVERALPRVRAVDRLNRAAWRRPDVVAEFLPLRTWTDVNEPVALQHVARHVRGRRILDVGVGAGRTTPFLRLLSDDYVAVDYTPEMVAAFRHNHPDVPVEEADARDLSRFESGSFGLVVFSFNGIDAVDHDDRGVVLRELRRVLEPGGWLVFSTHNRDARNAHRRPWHGGLPSDAPATYRAVRWIVKLPVRAPGYLRRYRNWWANRGLEVDRGDWAMRRNPAHDFSIVIHTVTLEGQRRELEALGFDDVTIYPSEPGGPLATGDSTSDARWFHVVARRSTSP